MTTGAHGSRISLAVVCLSALHFLSGVSWAVQRPQGFLVVLFLGAGIPEAGVGLISLVGLASQAVGGPLVGLIADRQPVRRRTTIYASVVVVKGAIQLLAWVALRSSHGSGALWGCLLSIGAAAFWNAGAVVVETTMRLVGASGFGRVRLWGGLGFAFGSLATGTLAQMFPSMGLYVVFLESSVLTALTLFTVWLLIRQEAAMDVGDLGSSLQPSDTAGAGRDVPRQGRTPTTPAQAQSAAAVGPEDICGRPPEEGAAWTRVARFMCSGTMPLFFASVFALGIGEGTMQMYTYVRLKELPHGTSTVMGLSSVCMIVSEVPFFYYAANLVRRFGVFRIVTIALVCQCLRQLWTACIWDARWVLPGELLHGITFSVANAAVCFYIREVAPEELRNTSQALLNTFFIGFGQGGATVIGAAAIRAVGTRGLFFGSSLFAAVAATLPCALTIADARQRRACDGARGAAIDGCRQ